MESVAAYDVLIIGGGQAGVPLAHALAGEGMTVALAERKNLGGSCINFGCTPTKSAIASAKVAHQARRAAEFGLRIPEVEVDFPAASSRGGAQTSTRGSRARITRSSSGATPASRGGRMEASG